MSKRTLAILLFLALAVPVLSACASSEPPTQPRMLLSLIQSINAGDAQAARSYTDPQRFTLTLADGSTLTGDAAIQALLEMPRPLRLRSARRDLKNETLRTEISFGSGKPVPVDVTGHLGKIQSMTIGGG